MNELTNAGELLQVQNGQPMADSRDVSERFSKKHKDVLKAIRNLDCSPEFNGRNFALYSYTINIGQKKPYYLMTRDGFCFLVMGFTGAEAAKWKERYIAAFNAMEARLREGARTEALCEAERELLNIYRRHLRLQDKHKKRGTKLTVEEKKAIWKMSTEGYSHHYIAKVLGRDASNIRKWQKLLLEYAEARHNEKEQGA